MLPRSVVAVAVAGLALAAATLEAQEDGFSVFVHGGLQSATADLSRGGSTTLENGFNVGGGVWLDLHRNAALRAEVSLARSDAEGPLLGTTTFDRLFYGADVQLRYPFANGLAPYVFGGAGEARISREGDGEDPVNSPAARFGAGVQFRLPNTPVRAFIQASGWHYKFFGWPGIDTYQHDWSYSAGVTYRIG